VSSTYTGLRLSLRPRLATLMVASVAALLTLSAIGCGNGNNSSAALGGTIVPGSSIAIDSARDFAYVPNGFNSSGYGIVDVVNLAADPNKINPVKAIITLSHKDFPLATLYYAKKDLVLIVSGQSGAGGYLDVFNAKTLQPVAGSPFSYASGSQAGNDGQIGLVSGKLFNDPKDDFAIVNECDNAPCSSGYVGTGFEAFDLNNLSGHSVTSQANYPEFMAANYQTGLVVDASDDDSPGQIGVFNSVTGAACVLSDSNLESDNDSAALDPATDIAVVSDGEINNSSTTSDVTILNLNGGRFSGNTAPCTFTESGTTPNSVRLSAVGTTVLEGGVVNPRTHQAFLVGDSKPGLALISLPKKPVAQLTASMVSAVKATMPNDPTGTVSSPQAAPYWQTIDPSDNKAYVGLEDGFLVRIDLATLAKHPSAISNPLPTTSKCGSSYGVTGTTAGCSNSGNAVVFYPLSGRAP
jgi:hypothetical protein